MPKVSVVVPIYNAEKYLHCCIDSILAQSFTDFELLLINDGSTDSSGQICDEYVQTDSRIRVFHKENSGVTSARKLGTKEAKSEWIAFVDADDYLSDDYLKKFMVNISGEEDVLACIDCECKVSSSDYIKDLLANRLDWGMWRKLYRTVCLSDDAVFSVPREINIGEDIITNIIIAESIKTVRYISNNGYINRKNNESVTQTRKWSIDYEVMFIKYLSNVLDDKKRFIDELWLIKLRSIKNLLINGIFVSRMHPLYKEVITYHNGLLSGIGDNLVLYCPFPRLTMLYLQCVNYFKR